MDVEMPPVFEGNDEWESCLESGTMRTIGKHRYLHLFVLGMVFAAFDAYGIGSNDVANAFATSVGSGSLTLKTACLIAIFTELIGAITLGSDVAETIKGKILDIHAFDGQPDTLSLAMLCALVGSSFWVNSATYIGMPVSTTHSIVGATIGVGIAFGGTETVNWGTCADGDCYGVLGIIVSWGLSPALAGCFGAAAFLLTKYIVLKAPDEHASFRRALLLYPVYVFITWTIVAFFMILKGAPELNESYKIYKDTSSGKKEIRKEMLGPVLLFSFGVGLFWAVLAFALTHTQRFKDYCLRSRTTESLSGMNASDTVTPLELAVHNGEKKCKDMEGGKTNGDWDENDEAVATVEAATDADQVPMERCQKSLSLSKQALKYMLSGINQDVTTITSSNVGADMAMEAHAIGQRFDPATERVYSAVQVLTASFASLAHGANDVANAVAPLCTIYWVWSTGAPSLSKKVPVETWILAFGGFFIDIGLSCSGWRIMKNLGNNITFHSPSRGFAMELGALTTVLYASQQGKPVSTTHCITGATIGVGLCNGNLKSINWVMVSWALFGWMLTLPCAAAVAGLLFALIAKSPKALRTSETFVYSIPSAAEEEESICFKRSMECFEHKGTL